jgi:hypothetical protein
VKQMICCCNKVWFQEFYLVWFLIWCVIPGILSSLVHDQRCL